MKLIFINFIRIYNEQKTKVNCLFSTESRELKCPNGNGVLLGSQVSS